MKKSSQISEEIKIHKNSENVSEEIQNKLFENTFDILQNECCKRSNHAHPIGVSKQYENIQISYNNYQNTDSKSLAETHSVLYTYDRLNANDNLLSKLDQISKNNISKNIIKAFFKYLLSKNNDLLTDFAQNGIQVNQARKLAKNFIQSYNYNNNYLHKLIQHPKYGKAFEFYLTFEAEKWLQESKVKEKEDHLIYIDFLKLCCCNPEYTDHLITYKKAKKNLFNDRI